MTEEEATSTLEEQDLEVVVNEEYNEKVEEGYVINQDVDAESEVGAGSTVTITVSKGEEKSTVPNVVGKTEEEATSAIESAGLTISATLTDEDTTKDNGVILKQSLEAGTTVTKGSSMTITVNKIQEVISGTVNINLKSLLNYTTTYKNVVTSSGTGNTVNTVTTQVAEDPDDVEVTVKVNDETVYKKEHKENETSISVPISGIGTVTVKVYVDDVLKTTKQINLNSTTTLTVE